MLLHMKTNLNLRSMRSVPGESCTAKQNTFYALLPPPPTPEYRAIYENVENYCVLYRPQMTVCRIRIACWVRGATNTHSEYIILFAFPLQKWLHECTSLLRYTCIACLVNNIFTRCNHAGELYEVRGSVQKFPA